MPNGTLVYTPNPDYNGPDQITYTISDGNGGTAAATVNITVNVVNDDPDAKNDTAITAKDLNVTINVLANDSDVDGDSLTVSSATNGTNGTVSITVDPTSNTTAVTYTPEAGFVGSDTFSYTVSDGMGGTATGRQ